VDRRAPKKSGSHFRGDHQGRPIHDGDEDSRPAVGRAIGNGLADAFRRP